MSVWGATLISVTIVSLISLIGVVTLIFNREWLQRSLLLLVSFSVGGLFGDAFIHLMPEAYRTLGFGLSTSLLIMLGIVLFFTIEKFIFWRHCHVAPCATHQHPLVTMNLIGDAVHNLIDGMIIGASFSVSIPLGVATTIAVILHEIPHELGNFGVFLHGGLSVKRALAYNFFSALTAIAGAVAALVVGEHVEGFSQIMVPITAGGFIYVAGSDIIPELKHDAKLSASFWQLVSILLGVAVMASLLLLE